MTDPGADDDVLMLNAFHDGELSPGETLAIERRLAAEPELRARAARLAAMSGAVQRALLTPPAPEALRRRIVDRIALRNAGSRNPAAQRGGWLRIAAGWVVGIATGVLLGSGLTYTTLRGTDRATTDVLLTAHLRALAAPQPFDVASSDRHTVKPWFNGKTPLAPQVPDLTGDGYVLLGARIDFVERRAVPTLVYRHDRHIIDVTVLPGNAMSFDDTERLAGYHIDSWLVGDLSYAAVSDLSHDDLQSFAKAFRRHTGTLK